MATTPQRINFCPVCGERMALDAKTNGDGDTLERWVCTITGDYSAEWDVRTLAPGTTAIPVAASMQENPVAREATAAQALDLTRRRLDDLLNRIGPVPAGGSVVEELRRVYSAVDTLELTAGNISLNSDAINLNTDTLENLQTSTNTRIGDPLDTDEANTLIGRIKRVLTVLGQAEAARDADAGLAQTRLDLLATEAGLTTTRDALTARLDTANAFLDAMPTLTELGASRQYVESIIQRRAREGLSYMASTGRQSLTLAGNVRTVLTNPAGSGRRLYIHRVTGSVSAGPAWATLILNPTTGLPAATRPISNVLLGGAASIAQLAADVNTTAALGGGTDTGLIYALFTGRTVVDLPAPILVGPGQSLGFNAPFAGAADSALTAYWWEEAI